MDPYTRLQLPYFAPAEQLPAPLPTFEEILSSKNVIGGELDWQQMTRVGKHFIAKIGEQVKLTEGENMIFVKNNTSVFAPAVYAIYQREHKGRQYNVIVMEHVPGDVLCLMLKDEEEEGDYDDYEGDAEGDGDGEEVRKIGTEEKESITTQLRAYVDELRRIPPPDYFGNIGRRSYGEHSLYGGPYNSVGAANEAFFRVHVNDMDNLDRCTRYKEDFEPFRSY